MILTPYEQSIGIKILRCGLKGPSVFDELSKQQVDDLTNGCGPSGAGWIVPERVFHASFRVPCRVHDISYLCGYTKKISDQIFYENCMEKAGKVFVPLRPAAEWSAFMYYLAVKNCGHAAYAKACQDGKSLGLDYFLNQIKRGHYAMAI